MQIPEPVTIVYSFAVRDLDLDLIKSVKDTEISLYLEPSGFEKSK